MEAGVTTLNIQAQPEPAPVQVQAPTKFANTHIPHNHKPNFGRYVNGCHACMAKWPDGPPVRTRRPPVPVPAAAPAEPGLTREDVIALLREHAPQVVQAVEAAEAVPMAEKTAEQNTLEKLVQLMLNREAKALVKDEADEARKLQGRKDMVRMAQEQEAMKSNIQSNCGWEYGRPGSHTKENGRSAINGQIHNDGLYHPICFRCFKAFPPEKPNAQQVRSGVTAG